MECIGDCKYSKRGECTNVKSLKHNRCMAIESEKAMHILNYAEEQLEHAKDKENRCYNKSCARMKENTCNDTSWCKQCSNRIKEPINYEEEYNKLKKENEKINVENRNYNIINNELDKNNHELNKENEEIKEKNVILNQDNHHFKKLAENRGDYNEKLDKENIELKESLDIAIKEADRFKEIAESLNKMNEAYEKEIRELNNYLQEQRKENSDLKDLFNKKQNQWEKEQVERVTDLEKVIEELKKQNNQGYMEQMNITLNEKNEEIKKLKNEMCSYILEIARYKSRDKIIEIVKRATEML